MNNMSPPKAFYKQQTPPSLSALAEFVVNWSLTRFLKELQLGMYIPSVNDYSTYYFVCAFLKIPEKNLQYNMREYVANFIK